ncbi:MAG: serine hydrolase [Bacilli bacterium]
MYRNSDKFTPKKQPANRRKPQSAKRKTNRAANSGRPQTSVPERRSPAAGLPSPQRQRQGQPKRGTSRKTASLGKHRRRRLKWGRLGGVLATAVLFGFGAQWLIVHGVPQLAQRLRADVAQVTAKSRPLPYTSGSYLALSRQIQLYLRSQPGAYAVAGTDLVTGASFGYGQREAFTAAGTIALPVVVSLYSAIAAGSVTPTTIVHLRAQDQQAGPGYIGGMPVGTPFTVAELARAAIVRGDVVAINMLIRKLGAAQIQSFMTEAGSSHSLSQPRLVTPRDLTLYLAYLYAMDRAHPRAVGPLMADLRAVNGEGRIAGGFPRGTRIDQVVGDWPKEFHDAAIIWTAGHPVALSICSDGVTMAAASKVEGRVAKIVANFEQHG